VRVSISKQAFISFFVSPYCGEVLYDVLLLDACHILLGRRWLFDNHVRHHGYANTYALKFKRHSLTLAPLPSPKPLKIKLGKKNEKGLYMSETHVERAISKSKLLCALLMVKSNTSDKVKLLHPLAQSLLREFDDVVPNVLPLVLPSLRGVKHQIELVLGNPLSNKSTYRCKSQ